METEISTLTEKQLAALEDKVRRGSAAFVDVGTALAKIREGKGYVLRGFKTWEDYCAKEFGFTDRQGRRLIQSAETAAAVKAIAGAAPANERVAREFTALAEKPEQLKKVAEQLEKKGFSVITATAEAVKEAVQKLAPKPKPVITPGSGKNVVIPGNGKPGGARYVAPVTAPMPDDELTDKCPNCNTTPNRYLRESDLGTTYWICETCKKPVSLSVAPVAQENSAARAQGVPLCPHCKKPINPGDSFCNSCGASL